MTEHPLVKWRALHPEGTPHAPARNPAQRWKDHDTRKTAIDAMCWHCMGGSEHASNGARSLIKDCTSGPASKVPCPLWAWRPYKANEDE